MTDVEYNILMGLHSRIPPCCVAEYADLSARGELAIIHSNLAKTYLFPRLFNSVEYVLCWKCLVTGIKHYRIHYCNPRKKVCRAIARIFESVYNKPFFYD